MLLMGDVLCLFGLKDGPYEEKWQGLSAFGFLRKSFVDGDA